jgi:hypothetical protein
MGTRIFTLNAQMNGVNFENLAPTGTFVCRAHKLPIPPSSYWLRIACKVQEEWADLVERAFQLNVVAGDYFGKGRLPTASQGLCIVRNDWTISAYEREEV